MQRSVDNFTHISIEIQRDLDTWEVAEERPTGSREKCTLIRQGDTAYFVFKHPKRQREHQIWSELLASYIAGDLLGWDVQHVSLGVLSGNPGNLLRYIYRPHTEEQFIEGYYLCSEVDLDYDAIKGQHHTFPLLLRTYDEVISPRYGISRADFMDFWSRAFALDTLISNTDRHAENWAIVESPSGARMAALYDNGSSMACGLDSVGLDRSFGEHQELRPDWVRRFRNSGRHHVRLEDPAKNGALFEPLCRKLLDTYPEGRAAFERAVEIDLEAVRALTHNIIQRVDLPGNYALTEKRAVHIHAVLQIGRQRIQNILREN